MKANFSALVGAATIAAALAVMSTPSSAQSNGMNFYNQCGSAFDAGFAHRAYCHNYLWGFAEALQASGQICMQPGTTDVQVVMVVQNWLRFHAQNLNRPAPYMIRNAMMNGWPCAPR